MQYIKINFTCFVSSFVKVAPRKFLTTYVAPSLFLLDSADLEEQLPLLTSLTLEL